jgi:hypothetical protein
MAAANRGSKRHILGRGGEKQRRGDSERLPPTAAGVARGGEVSTRNMNHDFHSQSQRKPKQVAQELGFVEAQP